MSMGLKIHHWFESSILRQMNMTDDDVLRLINICLASVEKQRQSQTGTMQQYLDGYEAACNMIKEMIEKSKNK